MKKQIYIIIALGLAGWNGASAQEAAGEIAREATGGEWTLRQCIDYAVSHNVDIRQSEISARQSEVEAHTARWARLPNLNASAGQGWNWGRTQTMVKNEETGVMTTEYVNASSHGTNAGLNASVPLFTGLQIPHQYALSKLNLKAAVADLDKAKEDLSIQVTQAYLQVLFNQELHDVALGQVELSRVQLARLERLAELGKASEAEVAESRARLAVDETAAVQTLNDYRLALLDLSQLIELPSPEGLQTVRPATLEQPAPLTPPDEIYQSALTGKPAIRAAQYRLEGSRHSIRIAQSAFYPQLSLNGSLSTNYYSSINRTFSQQLEDNFSKYLGLSLSIPLFNRFSTRNRVRAARLRQESCSLELEQAKKTLYKEIQQAWYNAAASESKLSSSRASAEASRESFVLISRKYENGKANAVEFDEAKQKLMKARSDELQAKYDYLFRTKILDFYKGVPIE